MILPNKKGFHFSGQEKKSFLPPLRKKKLSFSLLEKEKKRLILKRKSFLSSLPKEKLMQGATSMHFSSTSNPASVLLEIRRKILNVFPRRG